MIREHQGIQGGRMSDFDRDHGVRELPDEALGIRGASKGASTVELRPCPFCGNPGTISANPNSHGDRRPNYWVGCSQCWCAMGYHEDVETARTVWNRRTVDNEGAGEALRRALLQYEADPVDSGDRPSSWGKLDALLAEVRSTLSASQQRAPEQQPVAWLGEFRRRYIEGDYGEWKRDRLFLDRDDADEWLDGNDADFQSRITPLYADQPAVAPRTAPSEPEVAKPVCTCLRETAQFVHGCPVHDRLTREARHESEVRGPAEGGALEALELEVRRMIYAHEAAFDKTEGWPNAIPLAKQIIETVRNALRGGQSASGHEEMSDQRVAPPKVPLGPDAGSATPVEAQQDARCVSFEVRTLDFNYCDGAPRTLEITTDDKTALARIPCGQRAMLILGTPEGRVDGEREALIACEEVLRLIHGASGQVMRNAPMPKHSTFSAWRMAAEALGMIGGPGKAP